MRGQRELRVMHLDAFTDTPFGGNPATVVLDAEHISKETLQKIARELNVRETVFVSRSRSADFKFRYMTPTRELGFSGHPTIAGFRALIEEGLVEVVQDINQFTLETSNGILDIEIVRNDTTGNHEIQIYHQAPVFLQTYDPKDYAEALGLTLADFSSINPIQTVSTGTPHLMIPVSTQRALENIRPDWIKLQELGEDADYVSLQVFTDEVRDVTSDFQARHFAPQLGVDEDPVSGSGAGAMAGYILRYGLMDISVPVTSIVVEQGHYVGRPGRVFVEVTGEQNKISQIRVGGTAVIIFQGKLFV
ncbi:MAG: PhzF family phenazine biosynthesis isomerase [Candidatus Lokiarchaeota archaeon]|nr:PhzF family phenazine biosynthesis isomerase [Candidatus Lokiarchaeota archaeon]